MTGSFSLDWITLAVSLFNTILLLWLGLTVMLNAERRSWGIWMAGGGLLTGAAFFMIHSVILGLGFEHFGWAVNFWWRLGWIPVILAPFAWYLVMLWYTGYWEGRDNPVYRRHHIWLGTLLVVSLVMIGMFIFANPLPSIIQMTHLDLKAQPAIFGVPVLLFLYPPFILACIGLSLEALLRPGPTIRLMGHLARQRARPWLSAASFFLLLVSLLVAGFMAWVVLSARNTIAFLALARAAAWLDLSIETLIAASVVLTGQAIVTYEVFTGKALPRKGLLRFWQRALILAAGYSLLVGFSATLQIASIYSLLVSTALLVLSYALLSWRSYAEREHFIDSLRPFITSQQLYDQLLETPNGTLLQEAEPPFRALCSQVLGASRAALIPLGPLATLFGSTLAYPDPESAPALKIAEAAAKATPDTLYLPLEEGEACISIWAIPLWNGRGLCGILALGEKLDNGLYTQEEIEIARTAGERLIDLQASAEISRRLMALQRRQLAESQVLDRRARRVLHDEVLPRLHTILLSLIDANPNGETSEAQTLLADVHRQIADLLRDLPAATAPELRRLGLAGALQRVVEDELRPAFDEVSWQATPQAVQAASEMQPMQAEVVYYAAREVVRNAARHARPAGFNLPLRLDVRLNWNDGLEIFIQDNGVGLDNASVIQTGSGQGLALHSTLLAVIGGSLSVESEVGAYTRVRIYLPGEETA
jgi:signal transduction histidine kinase